MTATVDSYIAGQEPHVQEILARLRETIRAAVPAVTEEIKYGMPAFRYAGTYLIYVGAWKKHIGLYPVARDTPLEPQIAPYRAEKDTVRLKYKDPVPYELIGKIAKRRAQTISKAS